MNQKVHTDYYNARQEVFQELQKLQKYVKDHPDNLEIIWTDVSDMNYILSQLKQLNGEE